MRLFLDSSAPLAAAGSAKGVSCFVITEAVSHGWELVSSDYCAEETRHNLPKLGATAAKTWKTHVAPRVRFVQTSVTLDQPLVFAKAKDRPVVITALASRSDWLLTLDESDFHTKLGRQVYGLRLATLGEFLLEQRALGAV